MCLLIHFVLKNVYVPFGNYKYYVSIFFMFELMSFEHGGGGWEGPIAYSLQKPK